EAVRSAKIALKALVANVPQNDVIPLEVGVELDALAREVDRLIVVAHLFIEAREAVVSLGRRLRLHLVAVDLEVVVALHPDQVLVGVEEALRSLELLEASLRLFEGGLEGLELDAPLDELSDRVGRTRAHHLRPRRIHLSREL